MNQKDFANISIVGLIITIVIIGGAVAYFVFVQEPEIPSPTQKPQSPNETLVVPDKANNLLNTTNALNVRAIKTVTVSTKPITGSHPKLSHDGTKIAYRRIKTGNDGLWVVNVDGSGFRKLTDDVPSGEGTYDFGWSPDDKLIFYIKHDVWVTTEPAPSSLKVVEVETGLAGTVFQSSSREFAIKSPQWISQKEIAFVSLNEFNLPNSSVVVFDVGQNKVVQPSREITLYFWYIKGSTRTSPEQKSVIAFASTNGIVKELTPDGARSIPSLSFDGEKVGYAGIEGIVIIGNDGSNPKIISSQVVGDGYPIFSPSDNMFAYQKTRDDGHRMLESDIYIMNTDGTGEKKLTESGSKLAMEPSWSPDGKKIVFFYSEAQEGQIGIIELAKSN